MAKKNQADQLDVGGIEGDIKEGRTEHKIVRRS